MMISAIVLAAGQSQRMGLLKQLLPLGASTVLERTVENVISSGVDETIVVLGYRAREIMPRLEAAPVKVVVNRQYRSGMSASIIAGINAVAPGADAVMIVPADLPFIGSPVIRHLLDEFKSRNKGFVVPTCQGKRGHPVIISLKYREELLALRGDKGARDIIARHPEDVSEVEVDCPGIVLDIDTIEDYDRLGPGASNS